jgi:hypothetical protein
VDVEPLKGAYWEIVTDCLEAFHGYEHAAACQAVCELRHAIEFPRPEDVPPGYHGELFFHNEPFYVACDVAGRELDPAAVAQEYDALVRYRYGPAEDQLLRQGGFLAGVSNAH